MGKSGRVRKTGNKGEIQVARYRLRSLAIVYLLLATVLLSGCYFNASSSSCVRQVCVFTLFALSDIMRAEKGVKEMAEKKMLDKISIYIPQKKMEERPVERLIRLGAKKDRSINYLVVEAILEYLTREEKKGPSLPARPSRCPVSSHSISEETG